MSLDKIRIRRRAFAVCAEEMIGLGRQLTREEIKNIVEYVKNEFKRESDEN